MMRWKQLAFCCAVSACTSEAVPEQNAVISCTSELDCPAQWVCLPSTNTCSPFEIQEVPVASVLDFPEQRQFRSVPFTLELVDLDASSDNPEAVSLELEYTIGDAPATSGSEESVEWWSGTLDYEEPLQLNGPTPLRPVPVTWNAIQDTNTEDVPELVSASVDDRDEGVTEIVTFIPRVRLRIRATDDDGNRGPWVNSPTFDLGNRVPDVTNIYVPEEVTGGLVPIEFELSDSSSDPTLIAVQYRLRPDAEWLDAEIVLGQTLGVLTSPAPQRRVLVWDSTLP
ncbi:MAG: hypothetical protein AAFX94_18770, partial [Myxococcota bacterium]